MNKSPNHLHPTAKQQQPYKLQPFCLKLKNTNNNSSNSLSFSALSRLLDNLQPSQQQQVLTQKLTEHINTLNPSVSTHASQITQTLISQLNRKQLLQLLYDDIALMHKINEILTVLQSHSPPVTPPPSTNIIPHPSPLILKRCNSPLNSPQQLKSNIHTNQWKHHCIELQSKYNQIQQENIQLKCHLKLSQWKWFDIYEWILSLNNKHFTLYSQQLYDNLKIQNIDGHCLKILNENDWIQLGITDTNSTKLLVQQISKLFVPVLDNNEIKNNVPENKIDNSQNHVIEMEHKSTENIENKQQSHAHAKLPKTEVAKIKIIDRRSAFIAGLPTTLSNDKCLRDLFSRFGTIITEGIEIIDSEGSIAANSRQVKIHFESEQSVIQLIDYVNNYMVLEEMRVCKATFGFTFYCEFFILLGKCVDTQCRKIHKWCMDTEIMTDEMINRFRKMPCGTRVKKSNIGVTSRELTQMQSVSRIINVRPVNRNIIITQQAISQQVQINSLQQQLQMIRAKAIDEVTTLQKQLAAKTSAYDAVSGAYNQLQLEAEAMQIKCCVLDHKCMDLEKQLKGNVVHNVEEEVKNCEEENNKRNYREWNFNDVYSWIVCLHNGHFEKYKMIYNNLKVEEIDGKCLEKMDKGDIHRIGITGFRDKLLLMECIQKLIEDNEKV